MSKLNRRLLRAAGRLQAAYAATEKHDYRIDLPTPAWEELREVHRAWSTAADRSWKAAAASQRNALIRALEHLAGQLQGRLSMLGREPPPAVPQLRLIYEELVAAEGEFDGVQFEEGEISITTEPITLDEIQLGRFQIRLHLTRLGTDTLTCPHV